MAERNYIYPPDTRCEKCGHRYDEHHYRHPFVTSVQPVDPWARIAELEAEVERLRNALVKARRRSIEGRWWEARDIISAALEGQG